jgi:TIR domain
MNRKPLIFISHIKEEKELAFALKSLITDKFLNIAEVFVATDPTSIEMGREWLQRIKAGLRGCSVEIIFASPESVKRPWINFEAGAAWIRKSVPVIPLCHSGMLPSTLPSPLNSLQSATATVEVELRMIFPVLAKAIQCDLPSIDFSSFIAKVNEFETVTKQIQLLKTKLPTAETDGLAQHEFATLLEIAETASAPADPVSVPALRRQLFEAGYTGVAVSLALQRLSRMGLIEPTSEHDVQDNYDYPGARVTPDGWEWLHSNQDKIELRSPNCDEQGATEEPSTPEDEVPF